VFGPESPQVASTLTNLANAQADSYSATGDAASLEQAINLYELAVETLPGEDPTRYVVQRSLEQLRGSH